MITGKEIHEFSERVESMCDFFLDQIDLKDGSADIVALQKLKQEAADLQFKSTDKFDQMTIVGLADRMDMGG